MKSFSRLLIVLIAAIWAVGSWYIYTCKIKGFCEGRNLSAEVDTDNDGLPDMIESKLGLNPKSKDSDGDGMEDKVEVGTSFDSAQDTDADGKIDALDKDDDNDGISTADEMIGKSDPLLADTDSDGLSDGEELKLGSNPIAKDTDKDGVNDADEGKKDSDGDGVLDILDDTDDLKTAAAAIDKDAIKVESTDSDGLVIYYPRSSSQPVLSGDSKAKMSAFVAWLKTDKNNRAKINGHTDNEGPEDGNKRLGLKRAMDVREKLISLGADFKQLDVASHGETKPVADNSTADGREKNRRVEVLRSK